MICPCLPVVCCQSLTYHVSSGSWDVNESLIRAVCTCNEISRACPHWELTQCHAFFCVWSNSIHNVQLWMHLLELFKCVVWSYITNVCFVHVFAGAGGEDPDSGRTTCAPRLPHVPPGPATRERQRLLWSSGIWHNPWPQAQALAARGLFSPSVLNQFTSWSATLDIQYAVHIWVSSLVENRKAIYIL